MILHDIAKLEELVVGNLGLATAYSAKGQLLGHIPMGVSLVERAAKDLSIPDSLSLLVEHMLLAHHSQPEYGSPKPPMFPEAEVVALLDLMASRMFEMFSALEGVPVGEFTERVWALDNRQLFQHGHNFK